MNVGAMASRGCPRKVQGGRRSGNGSKSGSNAKRKNGNAGSRAQGPSSSNPILKSKSLEEVLGIEALSVSDDDLEEDEPNLMVHMGQGA